MTQMNLSLINLPPNKWSRDNWRDAYAQYCASNMFGPKTKQEYYDFVMARYRNLESNSVGLPPELRAKWAAGRRAAVAWAKKRGCDLNGRMLTEVRAELRDQDTSEMATQALDIATETYQKLDYLLERVRAKK